MNSYLKTLVENKQRFDVPLNGKITTEEDVYVAKYKRWVRRPKGNHRLKEFRGVA